MSFFPSGIIENKDDCAYRATQGQRNIPLPDHGSDESLALITGTPDLAQGLNINVPVGEHRHFGIPESNRITWRDAHRLFVAMCETAFVMNRMDQGELRLNAGTGAANMTNFGEWEVVDVSGNIITLRGTNPRKVVYVTSSMQNPEWPAPGEPKIISTSGYCSLPVGSLVKFLAPSALSRKLTPRVLKVNPPVSTAEDDVEFTIEVGYACDAAMEPENKKYPMGEVRCRVFFYGTFPPAFPRFERVSEAQFARRVVTFSRNDLLAESAPELKRSNNASGRVLPADAFEHALKITVTRTNGDTLVDDPAARLTITQGAGPSWTSVLELSAEAMDPSVREVEVEYWAEAVAGTDEGAGSSRVICSGKCANSWHDVTGSYAQDGDEVCVAVDADQRATHRQGCWQINCSKFCLGDETRNLRSGNMANPRPADFSKPEHFMRLWNNTDWILTQQNSGSADPRNFILSRPPGGAPSLGEMLGGWSNGVPGGLFPSRDEYFGRKFGRRETGTTVEGDEWQAVRYGAFAAAPWTDGDGDLQGAWSAGTVPASGILPALVSGWATKPDGNGGSLAAELAQFAYRGMGSVNVYNFVASDYCPGDISVRRSSAEMWIGNVSLQPGANEEDATGQRLRDILESL